MQNEIMEAKEKLKKKISECEKYKLIVDEKNKEIEKLTVINCELSKKIAEKSINSSKETELFKRVLALESTGGAHCHTARGPTKANSQLTDRGSTTRLKEEYLRLQKEIKNKKEKEARFTNRTTSMNDFMKKQANMTSPYIADFFNKKDEKEPVSNGITKLKMQFTKIEAEMNSKAMNAKRSTTKRERGVSVSGKQPGSNISYAHLRSKSHKDDTGRSQDSGCSSMRRMGGTVIPNSKSLDRRPVSTQRPRGPSIGNASSSGANNNLSNTKSNNNNNTKVQKTNSKLMKTIQNTFGSMSKINFAQCNSGKGGL